MPATQRPSRDEYLRPGAFDQAIKAFAGEDVAGLLAQMEHTAPVCPRLALSACLHGFLLMERDKQLEAVARFLRQAKDVGEGVSVGEVSEPNRNSRPLKRSSR